MNLGKIEKTIIAILVIGAIIGFGIFLFIVPSFNKIGTADKRYESLLTEQQTIYEKLERENTIDEEIKTAKKESKDLEGSFYPDLTTYEATEATLAYLEKSNLVTHSISVSEMTTYELMLQAYEAVPVEYQLKTYSEEARGIDEDALLEGQFKDGNKVYTVTSSGITDIEITDEEGNVIEKTKYTDMMKKVYNKTLCTVAASNETMQVVGAITLDFEIEGLYKDYLAFLDYVNSLERASRLNEVRIPMTIEINEDSDSNALYVDEAGNLLTGSEANGGETVCEEDTPLTAIKVSLTFFCVEPMEDLATIDAADAKIVVNQ